MNYIAIAAAGVSGFVIGAIWYGILGNAWASALGKTKSELKPGPAPLIAAFLCNLFMAYILAGLIGHLGEGQVTVRNGMISGAFAWAGFVATTMITNYAFQGHPPKLSLIDGGHWLIVLLTMGAIIGFLGV